MAKFTNVDYNKNLVYSDSNPFAESFKTKYEEGKNAAIEAYKTKVNSVAEEGMYNLRNSLKGPDYDNLILNKGTDAEMLNPDFYKLLNFNPESALSTIREEAKAKGLNPKSIRSSMVITDELTQMKNAAVQQHYDALAQYADEYGDSKLQKLLEKEGSKFTTFYRKFTDPYAESTRGSLYIPPGAQKQLSLARRNPGLADAIASGQTFKEKDGKIYATSGALSKMNKVRNWARGDNMMTNEIKTDSEGRMYMDTGGNPIGALLSNIFGSGNIDMYRTYLPDEENKDQWFDWAR
jgi:hypothetical protein